MLLASYLFKIMTSGKLLPQQLIPIRKQIPNVGTNLTSKDYRSQSGILRNLTPVFFKETDPRVFSKLVGFTRKESICLSDRGRLGWLLN
jgi:hypothetical protein